MDTKASLSLDECSNKVSVDYDGKGGSIMGESIFPNPEGDATKALVFMLSGVSTIKWKQVFAYYFIPNVYDGREHAPITTSLIKMSREVGTDVVSISTDMGSQNVAVSMIWYKLWS
ncbi:unnamed protein product [Lepeophtheirus salmonis]|uniref:(salmon louse) hypothetical protein n=1 Tax=Lepeophtheirus salmonis TaxID=72036 RepID=A0A7R8D0V3_LEPSM|nr:unnamed protein product [Lepeophtheirus salmonis]CAF2962111.1 unnamed protein product [Lepeophtheirus salmonis]